MSESKEHDCFPTDYYRVAVSDSDPKATLLNHVTQLDTRTMQVGTRLLHDYGLEHVT